MRLTFYALFCAFVFSGFATALKAGEDRSRRAESALESMLEEDHGSGAMAAVFRDGELVWHGEAGYADLESRTVLAPNHRLRIGSVSKLITAALVMKLASDGVVDLDASIRKYRPDLPEDFEPVTLRMLGRHLSGLRHYDFSNFQEANNRDYFDRIPLPPAYIAVGSASSAPGDRFEYSSIGYNLMGAVLEAALSSSFDTLLQQHVAIPLGLGDTLSNDSMKIIERRAKFYTVGVANPLFPWMQQGQLINTIFRDDSDLYPSGGLLSNAIDLARFGDRVFNSEFIPERLRSEMVHPTQNADGSPAMLGQDTYGFGVILYRKDGRMLAYGHGGLTNGGQAELVHFPDSRTTIAVVTNYNAMGPSGIERLAKEELAKIFVPGHDGSA